MRVLALLAVAGGLTAGLLLPQTAVARDPAYLQVVQKEWKLELSRQRVQAGQVIVEAVDFGMDAHNLAVRRNAPGAPVFRLPAIQHGGHTDRTLRLTPGRYTL